MDEFASAVGGQLTELLPFDIVLGGLNSFRDAAFLDVGDVGHCTRLHRRLFELAAIPRAPRFAYLPHVALAHYTADAPLGGLVDDLAAWRDLRFGAVRVETVEIVATAVDEPYPPLKPYAALPLRR